MKSLKISLVLFFALLLCSSCVGNDRKDTDSDTNRPESSAVERTRRMRARARKQVENWIRQVQNTADAYLR